MKKIGVRDRRAMLPRHEALVACEGEVVIARRGRPIARLLPVRATGLMLSHAEFRAGMPRLGTGSEVLVRRDRSGR